MNNKILIKQTLIEWRSVIRHNDRAGLVEPCPGQPVIISDAKLKIVAVSIDLDIVK